MNDYKEMLALMESPSQNLGDVYTELIKKEDKVLDVLNRMTEFEVKNKKHDTLFYNATIYEAIAMFANTWKNIFVELFVEKRFRDVDHILLDGDRKIYFGIMMILIAFSLFFVSIT